MLSKNPLKSGFLLVCFALPRDVLEWLFVPLDRLLSFPLDRLTLRLFLKSMEPFAFPPGAVFGRSAAGLWDWSRRASGMGGTGGTASREYARARADWALFGEGGEVEPGYDACVGVCVAAGVEGDCMG